MNTLERISYLHSTWEGVRLVLFTICGAREAYECRRSKYCKTFCSADSCQVSLRAKKMFNNSSSPQQWKHESLEGSKKLKHQSAHLLTMWMLNRANRVIMSAHQSFLELTGNYEMVDMTTNTIESTRFVNSNHFWMCKYLQSFSVSPSLFHPLRSFIRKQTKTKAAKNVTNVNMENAFARLFPSCALPLFTFLNADNSSERKQFSSRWNMWTNRQTFLMPHIESFQKPFSTIPTNAFIGFLFSFAAQ